MNCLLIGKNELDVADDIQQVLQTDGCQLIALDTLVSAQSAIEGLSPDLLILCDPDENALAFADRYRAQTRASPVIVALFKDTPSMDVGRLFDRGMDGVIVPPLTLLHLQCGLKGALQLASGRTALLTEEATPNSDAKMKAILETTVDGIITIDERGIIESFNKSAEDIFGYSAQEVIGKSINLLMPASYAEEHDSYLRSYRETGHRKIIGIGREVQGLRKNGEVFPMDLAVSEIHLDGVRHFTGIIRDITERKRLELQLLALSEQEGRRIGQDLHDGLGQMLTGLGLLAKNLTRNLENKNLPEAHNARELMELLKDADQQARALTRTLVPVELERGGLHAALHHFCSNLGRLYDMRFVVEEMGMQKMPDALNAYQLTHFYRIIQEALNNAARHSHASQVHVVIVGRADLVKVRVQDNGIGINPDIADRNAGMGLRIMAYRASVIGATLDIRKGNDHGTILTCTLPALSGPQVILTAEERMVS